MDWAITGAGGRHLPEILAARVSIYQLLRKWELMQTDVATLAEHDPDNLEWALNLESMEAAKVILLAASEKHPEQAIASPACAGLRELTGR